MKIKIEVEIDTKNDEQEIVELLTILKELKDKYEMIKRYKEDKE